MRLSMPRCSNGSLAATFAVWGGLVGWGYLILSGNPAAADPSEMSAPAVVVLRMANTGSNADAEERFVAELELALNRFRVVPLRDPSGRFSEMSFVERLALVRDLSRQHRAAATVWVERWDNDKIVLNLTAMSTGRALVKIVEVTRGPSQEAELALAAEALLGEAYLFSRAAAGDAVREKVDRVRRAAMGMPSHGSRSNATFALSFFGTAQGAIFPRQGPSLLVGGGLAWTAEFPSGWFLSPVLAGFGGPKERFDDGLMTGWGLQGELLFGFRFHLDRAAVAPAVGAGLRFQQIESAFGGESSNLSRLARFRGSLSLDVQIPLSENLALFFRFDLGALSNPTEFKRVSNQTTLLETPLLDGGVAFGLRALFSSRK